MGPPYAVADVATAAYCGRKAYLAGDDDGGEPPPEVDAVRELGYRYPALIDRPLATVAEVCGRRGVDPDVVDLDRLLPRLAALHDGSLWRAVARPWREETVLRTERLVGRLDKILRLPSPSAEGGDGGGDGGGADDGADGGSGGGGGGGSGRSTAAAPALVSAGRPPTDGVWRSQRVRCAALVALLDGGGVDHDGRAVVEYPRVGAVRTVRVGERDRRGLADAIDALDAAERGHPPSRTSNPSKCNACRFRERCGVPTRTLRSRLADRLPWTGGNGDADRARGDGGG